MEDVYTLRLSNGCWYVGRTANLEARAAAHFAGEGAAWTREHRVLAVHASERVAARDAAGRESRVTAELMWQHGVSCVRGAQFCKTEAFTEDQEDELVAFLGHSLDKSYDTVRARLALQLGCGVCGRLGHRAEACSEYSSDDEEEDEEEEDEDACYRCGRPGHWASECYARTSVTGQRLY